MAAIQKFNFRIFQPPSVVRVWVFCVRSSSPFPAKQLGRDVRAECSKETERMGNETSERGGVTL